MRFSVVYVVVYPIIQFKVAQSTRSQHQTVIIYYERSQKWHGKPIWWKSNALIFLHALIYNTTRNQVQIKKPCRYSMEKKYCLLQFGGFQSINFINLFCYCNCVIVILLIIGQAELSMAPLSFKDLIFYGIQVCPWQSNNINVRCCQTDEYTL